MTTQAPKIGIDVGGVIIDRANDSTDTSFFSDNFLRTSANAGAFEALATLNRVYFPGEVYIVSKCGANVERKTRLWFAHHDLEQRTGIAPEKWNFCRSRPEKAPICERLQLTYFIDDKLEVLNYLTTVPNRILFKPDDKEIARQANPLCYVRRESWASVMDMMSRHAAAEPWLS